MAKVSQVKKTSGRLHGPTPDRTATSTQLEIEPAVKNPSAGVFQPLYKQGNVHVMYIPEMVLQVRKSSDSVGCSAAIGGVIQKFCS
jgi:hypothetical protein